MAAGGGKYGPECEVALKATRSGACVLIVIDGDRGSGFSAAFDFGRTNAMSPTALATMLREVADQIEKDAS